MSIGRIFTRGNNYKKDNPSEELPKNSINYDLEEKKTKYEPGESLEVKIEEVRKYGAMAKVLYDEDNEVGLIHISEITTGYVDKINKYLKTGDIHVAKVIDEPMGRLCLTLIHDEPRYEKGIMPKYQHDTVGTIRDVKEEMTEFFEQVENLVQRVEELEEKLEKVEKREDKDVALR